MASTTSSALVHRAINAGRRSIIPLKTPRRPSYSVSPGWTSSPPNPGSSKRAVWSRTSAMPALSCVSWFERTRQYPTPVGSRIKVSAPVQRFLSGFKGSLATMGGMTRPWSPRTRPGSPRRSRPFAALAAFVTGARLVGFTATAAGAQSSGGGLNVGNIQSSVDPAVATVNTTLAGGPGQAAGTGMVIGSSGEILTNNHVIENASSVRVQIGGGGRSYSANVLGYNVPEDVALLKIDGVSGLGTVHTDDTVSVGEPVVALGHAGGRGGTPDASMGAVRGVGETIQVADSSGSQTLRNLIRVDASLQPRDSGGPLVDAQGDVVGMNTAASTGGGFRLRT